MSPRRHHRGLVLWLKRQMRKKRKNAKKKKNSSIKYHNTEASKIDQIQNKQKARVRKNRAEEETKKQTELSDVTMTTLKLSSMEQNKS